MITPIIEYLPLEIVQSKQGKAWEVFQPDDEDAGNTEYLREIQSALKGKKGIYLFYDSVGRAIYAGKAQEQSLWAEIKSAFNRDRGKNQKIYYVQHPLSNNRAGLNHYRPISSKPLQMHDLAAYLSAYEVKQKFIPHMEAFLIRAFANSLMNGRIENFPGMKAD